SDWSPDGCSSDLGRADRPRHRVLGRGLVRPRPDPLEPQPLCRMRAEGWAFIAKKAGPALGLPKHPLFSTNRSVLDRAAWQRMLLLLVVLDAGRLQACHCPL